MVVSVGIIGATGVVGQRYIQLIEKHPFFEIEVVTASDRSVGKSYRDAVNWGLDTPMPKDISKFEVKPTDAKSIPEEVEILFSALPSQIASKAEPELCKEGYIIASNSSNERMSEDVPLIIPEINPDHLELIEIQQENRGWDGALIKNPNCSVITLAPTLKALDIFGLERVHVATLQAVSGAGYEGVKSMQILDNVIPFIQGEEEKLETEPQKILGGLEGDKILMHNMEVSASCNRVGVIDGHLENVWAGTEELATVEKVKNAFKELKGLELHSSPEVFIEVFEEEDRPQPRLDRNLGEGMSISVGGIKETSGGGIQYNCLAHNTIRGAAGASILNGELLMDSKWF